MISQRHRIKAKPGAYKKIAVENLKTNVVSLMRLPYFGIDF